MLILEKGNTMRMYAPVVHCIAVIALLSGLGLRAAEPKAPAQINLENKVVIFNATDYPIYLTASDHEFSLRVPARSYGIFGRSIDDVQSRGLTITTFGHSGDYQKKGEKPGSIPVAALIAQAQGVQHPGLNTFLITILPPKAYGLLGGYSDWNDKYKAQFDIVKVGLPSTGDPYDIPEFKSVKDLVSTAVGATYVGYFSSIDDFKKRDKIRWARLILGLPKEYTRDSVEKAFKKLSIQYHPDKFPGATPREQELVKQVSQILGEARETLKN